ncbi:MAG: TetR/AcrR family transcriptional regulator [Gammaproteobacteria bacterium]|jgi:TetR/AcrR family hemagglutinin/protease transcriptional regulator
MNASVTAVGTPDQAGGRPARRRLSPAARRAQLLECALAIFADRGLGRAGHARIAEAAGVSVPTVFHYFPTREALVDAVLDEVEGFFMGLARDVYAGDGPVRERLVAHGLAFLEATDSHPAHIRVWLDWSTAIREHVWPRYLAFQERLVALVAEAIETGRVRGELPERVAPASAARLFVGNAHMAAVMKFAPDTGFDLNDHVHRAVDVILASRPATSGPARQVGGPP